MDKAFWEDKWSSGQVNFDRSDANPLLTEFFKELSLAQNARVLVPLCGRSVDMQWLMAQGFFVLGVEFYEPAARQFFELHGLVYEESMLGSFKVFSHEGITIFVGDFFALTKAMLGPIDGIYDRAALIALPDHMRRRYAQHIIDLSDEATKMLLVTTVYDQTHMPGPPFSVNIEELISLYGHQFSLTTLLYESITVSDNLRRKGLLEAHDLVVMGKRVGFTAQIDCQNHA